MSPSLLSERVQRIRHGTVVVEASFRELVFAVWS